MSTAKESLFVILKDASLIVLCAMNWKGRKCKKDKKVEVNPKHSAKWWIGGLRQKINEHQTERREWGRKHTDMFPTHPLKLWEIKVISVRPRYSKSMIFEAFHYASSNKKQYLPRTPNKQYTAAHIYGGIYNYQSKSGNGASERRWKDNFTSKSCLLNSSSSIF